MERVDDSTDVLILLRCSVLPTMVEASHTLVACPWINPELSLCADDTNDTPT